MSFGYLGFLALLFVPAHGFSKLCANRVLKAAPAQRSNALGWVMMRFAFFMMILALLIYVASAVTGATGRESDIMDTFLWLTVKSGLGLAAMGWATPLVVTGQVIATGGGPNAARLVWVAPLPFLALALAVAWYFGLRAF